MQVYIMIYPNWHPTPPLGRAVVGPLQSSAPPAFIFLLGKSSIFPLLLTIDMVLYLLYW